MSPDPTIRREFGAIAAVGAGTFAFAFQVASILVMLPWVRAFLGPFPTGWFVTSYLLCLTTFVLLFGHVGDSFGNRRTYILGMALFTAAAFACAAARGPLVLLAARSLQGIGAALASANSPALLTRQIAAQRYGRALGWQMTMTYLGLAAGPVFAGGVLPHFGWRAVFLAEGPAGLLAIVLAWSGLRPDIPVDAGLKITSLPLRSASLWIACLFAFTVALSEGEQWGWRSWPVASLLVLSVTAAIVLVARESRSCGPLLSFPLLRHTDPFRSVVSETLVYGYLYALGFLVPILAMRQSKTNTALAATMLLWQALTRMVATPLAGFLSDRFGSVRLLMAGYVVLATATLILILTWPWTGSWTLTLLFAFAGLGSSLFVPANSRRLFAAIPLGVHGAAAGMLATARNLGMLLGTAIAAAWNASALRLHAGVKPSTANVRATLCLALAAPLFLWLAEFSPVLTSWRSGGFMPPPRIHDVIPATDSFDRSTIQKGR